MTHIQNLRDLPPERFEIAPILKKLTLASRKLAELKGVAAAIPNQSILINTLGMQEAKDSSAVENIVTTHDELFQDDLFPEKSASPAAKEVLRYRQALRVGFDQVRQSGLLTAIEATAEDTIATIQAIRVALMDTKHRIRAQYKFYSQDLINNLFTHPYTKIEFIERDLNVSRLTATKYLDALAAGGFLQKHKKGRSNYYINLALNAILTRDSMKEGT
jgi:Fic family protein